MALNSAMNHAQLKLAIRGVTRAVAWLGACRAEPSCVGPTLLYEEGSLAAILSVDDRDKLSLNTEEAQMEHISLAFAAALVSSTFALADTPVTPAEAEKIKAALHLLYPFIG